MKIQAELSRRSILKSLAASLALPGVVSGASGQSQKPGWNTAIGLNGFASAARKYRKGFPIWEILDFASRSGFDGVELVSDWPAGGYPAGSEADRIRALRRQYDAFGLKIFSLQLGAGGAFAPEEAARSKWLEEFRDRAQLARALGCDCVGLWPGGGLRGQTIDQAAAHLGRSLGEAAKIAGDLGLVAAFEIEPPFVFNTEQHMQRILERANQPLLKVIYDPSHFDLMNGSTGRPHEMLQRIGVSNIGYLHLTDTDGTLRDGGTSKHLPCGDGHVEIARSLQILREGGFRGWVMIDEWEIPDPYDACTKGMRAIQQAWREGGARR
ncbi:MAG: sugar phosphate isomerase/epimerase [Verrucomicrobia bacterium]|nr:sugar phosphate isomerase/epimerase [Verrucomicrobiota bacterium]